MYSISRLMGVFVIVAARTRVFSFSFPPKHCCSRSSSPFRRFSSAMDDETTTKKFHHFTVCIVPPEDSTEVWNQVTRIRTELKDPGLYRWPPHANLLYPFLDPFHNDINEIINGLQRACCRIEPFTVKLQKFGTFGGKKRGVLWLDPETEGDELTTLQQYLEEEFPFCDDQRRKGDSGVFRPHMTISHFPDVDSAQQAQTQVEAEWPTVLSIPITELYVLHRRGDDGQFQKVATISLGAHGEATIHESPLRFSLMPTVEADWVREERMKLKQRRNRSTRGRRKRQQCTNNSHSPTAEEVGDSLVSNEADVT